ncbi:MAG: hypothetical protein Q9164_001613 [Protoblastenia rupestris]
MRITSKVADRKAEAYHTFYCVSNKGIERVFPSLVGAPCEHVIQSSYIGLSRNPALAPSKNGFLWAVIDAYNHHHYLIIRTDEVWLAILTQLIVYINANAEKLRRLFVPQEAGNTSSMLLTTVPLKHLTGPPKMEFKLNDPDLIDWILPTFTTTTETDEIVASVDILERLDKLKTFGEEAEEWYHLLVPVLKRFIAAFDAPKSKENKKFLRSIAHATKGSVTTFLSGWITAFFIWIKMKKDSKNRKAQNLRRAGTGMERCLVVDRVKYHHIDIEFVPVGNASVPVQIADEGGLVEYGARMAAGSAGIEGVVGEGGNGGKDRVKNTLRPEVAWMMYKDKGTETRDAILSASEM